MDAMIQQCMQMMSQMSGMTGSGMMGSTLANGMAFWTSPWYWFGWLLFAALLVLLIVGVVWMIRATRRPASGPETPLNILQLRLARGEVSPEQFEAMKRQLA